MKTVYIAYFEEDGEFEGAFDGDFKLIGAWDCNDANWRGEYFDGFMKELGIEVKDLPKTKHKAASAAVKEYFGLD